MAEPHPKTKISRIMQIEPDRIDLYDLIQKPADTEGIPTEAMPQMITLEGFNVRPFLDEMPKKKPRFRDEIKTPWPAILDAQTPVPDVPTIIVDQELMDDDSVPTEYMGGMPNIGQDEPTQPLIFEKPEDPYHASLDRYIFDNETRRPRAVLGRLRHNEDEISTLTGEDRELLDNKLAEAAKKYLAKHEAVKDTTAEFEFARDQLLARINKTFSEFGNPIVGNAYGKIYGIANKALMFEDITSDEFNRIHSAAELLNAEGEFKYMVEMYQETMQARKELALTGLRKAFNFPHQPLEELIEKLDWEDPASKDGWLDNGETLIEVNAEFALTPEDIDIAWEEQKQQEEEHKEMERLVMEKTTEDLITIKNETYALQSFFGETAAIFTQSDIAVQSNAYVNRYLELAGVDRLEEITAFEGKKLGELRQRKIDYIETSLQQVMQLRRSSNDLLEKETDDMDLLLDAKMDIYAQKNSQDIEALIENERLAHRNVVAASRKIYLMAQQLKGIYEKAAELKGIEYKQISTAKAKKRIINITGKFSPDPTSDYALERTAEFLNKAQTDINGKLKQKKIMAYLANPRNYERANSAYPPPTHCTAKNPGIKQLLRLANVK